MKHSLTKTGLSMTQAQTVSNLCNQASTELLTSLSTVNNASKVLDFNGKLMVKQVGVKLPSDLEDKLDWLGKYRACQAFLMEQLKAKDAMMNAAKKLVFTASTEQPKRPEMATPQLKAEVDDQWGWDQLTTAEMAEYWEAEARAAVIGQFIHKGGKLDQLRKELPSLVPIEWFVAPGHEGKAHPVSLDIHHTEDGLWDIHEKLASVHREYEQRVNYFKAKVKNLVTLKNAEINKDNSQEMQRVRSLNESAYAEYNKEHQSWLDKTQVENKEFEAERLKTIKEISALRISVDPRFQPVVDKFLKSTEE